MAEAVKASALLPERLDRAAAEARRKLSEDDGIAGMGLAWDYVGGRLREALAEALDCDLMELLADGWARAPLLAEFADPDRHPPGERWSIALGEHELGRDLRPVVAVTIGSCPCVELAFDLALTAHFGGVQLTVADGRIVGGSLGEAWASAELSYQGVPLHEAAESRRVALPAAFEFAGPGIAIPLLA